MNVCVCLKWYICVPLLQPALDLCNSLLYLLLERYYYYKILRDIPGLSS